MITVLTDSNKIVEKRVILDINVYFQRILYEVRNIETFLTEKDLDYLRKIDKISKLDGQYIETPFGGTDVAHLSTGSKTIVLLGFFKWKGIDKIVSLNSCGANVLELIFTDSRYKDDTFFLSHEYFPDVKTYPFKVDKYENKEFSNLRDYLQYRRDMVRMELNRKRGDI